MNPLDYIKSLDHHAYFIHSFKDSAHKLKEFLFEKFNIKYETNPDFFYEKFESLGIDDSRRIKEIHLSKSFATDGKRIFIIETSAITHEAQNSLLKMFEEPNEDSHFFLIMPSVHTLLPTLRSRLLMIESKEEIPQGIEIISKVEEFLKLSKKDKVAFVDDIAKDISDEKLNKSDAIEFLAALEVIIYKKYGTKKPEVLKAILKARDYMNDRSASVKQLLEFVALHF
jgi:DNA polymerase III delta prime subunit